MADDFDRAAFASGLMEAGTTPAAAAAYARLFEELVVGTLATSAHIAAVQTQIFDLRNEVGAESAALREAIRQDIAPLLKEKDFHMAIRKTGYRMHLENMQMMVNLALASAVVFIVVTILAKLL